MDGGGTDGFAFKLFHEQVSYNDTDGGIHGYTMDLFIILTLEGKVGTFQAAFQQCGDVLYGHGGPAM